MPQLRGDGGDDAEIPKAFFFGTPRDATELTETAAMRRRGFRSRLPPFGLLPQLLCGALRVSATGTTGWWRLFIPVGCCFISNDVTRIYDLLPITADYQIGEKQSAKKVRLWILIFLLFYGFCSCLRKSIFELSEPVLLRKISPGWESAVPNW